MLTFSDRINEKPGLTMIRNAFPTALYRSRLTGRKTSALLQDLETTCRQFAAEDTAGQKWAAAHAYHGYTSYASLDDLTWRASVFADLAQHLDRHAAAFARHLEFDLGGRKLALNSIWINLLHEGGSHSAHIHPGSVISGTVYIATPMGAGAIKFEDPRLGFMMAAPAKRERVREENRRFLTLAPSRGSVLLWESWLRHEVLPHCAAHPRISISFNYS